MITSQSRDPRLDEYVTSVVAKAPPLTITQLDLVATLLAPADTQAVAA